MVGKVKDLVTALAETTNGSSGIDVESAALVPLKVFEVTDDNRRKINDRIRILSSVNLRVKLLFSDLSTSFFNAPFAEKVDYALRFSTYDMN